MYIGDGKFTGTHSEDASQSEHIENVQIFPLPPPFFFLTTVLSHWDFSHGNFGLLSWGKLAVTVALPNLRCMLCALVFP